MTENWFLTMLISAVITWGWGLSIPLLIRFAIVRKPISKILALVIVGVLWIINLVLFIALGSQSKTHVALFLVAWVSYGLLHRGYKQKLGG